MTQPTGTAKPESRFPSSRPLLLRMRPDLVVQQQTYLGRNYWVIKDPLALKYYRFEEEEYALLEMLDGSLSLHEMQSRFEQRFAPQKIALREIYQFVGMLHRSALVVSDAPGQGEQLLQRHRERTRRERLARVSNILCIRFRGIDPDRVLTWLSRRLGWLFSVVCVMPTLSLVAMALLLIAVQFDVFRGKLPAFHDFFVAHNWFWLAVTLTATKVLHEFAHGLACKRFGGECHEMGFMLLVLTPCLYCNVSDSWMLPSKWRRAAIGAAGMYVEVVLAALCTFVWWFTQPGLLHFLCLNVMFVCSVSTLLFNANPLMRFDGYYILSDLLEIPNLRQKASSILRRKLSAWALGMRESPDPFLPNRRQLLFALYSLAAAVYRWLISLAILWFLYRVFEPYGMKVVGQLIALFALYGLLVQPLWQMFKFFHVPGRMDQVKKPRLVFSVLAASLVAVAVFTVPVPHFVRCSVYVAPREAASVYVESPGRLTEIYAHPGDWVRRGQPILRLGNIDIELTLTRLAGQKQKLQSRLAGLRQRAFEDDGAALQITEVEQAIASVDAQMAQQKRDSDRLVVAAPASGVVLAPEPRKPTIGDTGRLPGWSGSPLEDRNLQAVLQAGVSVCQIGDPKQLSVILAIDQADLEFVHVGQSVDIVLAPLPWQRFTSRLQQLSQMDMKFTPDNLSSKQGGSLLSRSDTAGQERPLNTTYQASAPLHDEEGQLFLGATGQARIHTGSQTIARRVWRYVCQTFHM